MDLSTSSFLKVRDLKQIEDWIKRVKKKDIHFRLRKKVARKEFQFPYPEVGCGARRICFDLGNGFVVKVATGKDGIKHCAEEWRLYDSLPLDLKKHFSEARAVGEGWIVMEKIEKKVPQTKEYVKKLSKLRRLLNDKGIIPYDMFSGNIKLNENDDIVIIDYSGYRWEKEIS